MAKGEAPQAKGDGKRDVLDKWRVAWGEGGVIKARVPSSPATRHMPRIHMKKPNPKTRRWLYLGTALVALFAGSFWLLHTTVPTVVAAACPFTDNDGNDADATVDTYQLASSQNVAASATAYDCTTITLFKIPTGVTLTLLGNTSTGAIAQMNFADLQIDSGGAVSANGQGCPATDNTGGAANSSNICVPGAASTGSGIWG